MDAKDLVDPILKAVKPILSKHWNDVKEYAETEAKKMAETLATIAKLRVANQIDDAQAKALLDMQKNAMQAVLLAIEGIGLIAAQRSINAGLDAIKDVVNKSIGIALI